LPNVHRFAFDPRRLALQKRDALETPSDEANGTPQVEWLIGAAIQRTFGDDLREPSPSSELNRRIAAGVLACYLPEMVANQLTGDLRWQSRIESLADRAEGMVSQLLMSNL